MTRNVYDVAIAGAGIAGASLAFELAATHRVLLLEMENQPGAHATGRSAALFSTIYGNAAIRALSRASEAALRGGASGPGRNVLSRRGTMFIATADQEDAIAAMAHDPDVATHTACLGARDIEKLVPLLVPGRFSSGLYEPGSSDIDVDGLHQAYLRGFTERGGEIITGSPVTAMDTAGDHWRITAGAQEIAAHIVVNAAGAWADVSVVGTFGADGCAEKRRSGLVWG